MKQMPWLRLYCEAIDDEKLRLLAFEDRWHFVAILCLKASGILDANSGEMLHRKVAVKLGLTIAETEKVAKRLEDVGLIDRETFQPLAWDARQFASDSSTERVRAYRDRVKNRANPSETLQKRSETVSVTPQDTDTETDTEAEKRRKPRASARVDRPPDVQQQTWDDYQQVRAAKRSPITATALSGLRREADRAGMTLQDLLALCCERGWLAAKAEWLERDRPRSKQSELERRNAAVAASWVPPEMREALDAA